MTHCTTQLTFPFYKKRELLVDFDGGEITSDAGLLLVREADDSLCLVKGLSNCILDERDQRYINHDMLTLLRQRIYQIVAGYEDCNDADVVKRDPSLKAACDRLLSDDDLASQPTLSRLENAVTIKDIYKLGEYFVDLYIM